MKNNLKINPILKIIINNNNNHHLNFNTQPIAIIYKINHQQIKIKPKLNFYLPIPVKLLTLTIFLIIKK